MTPSVTFRPLAALVLAAGVFLALPGCGSDKPQPSGKGDDKNKPGEPKPGPVPGGDPKTPTPTPTPTPAKVDITTGVGKEAIDFLQAVRGGTATADKLSAPFAKAVGLPVVFDGDKAKGFSASAAEDWMRKVGASTGFGLPLKADQVGDVALFRGMLVGKQGSYSLRMVKEGGAWKVDWLSASTANVTKGVAVPTNSGDAILQEFAATAVVEAICDQDAMPAQQRNAVIAAGLTPALRTSWASPLDADKTAGYDYSPAKLGFKIGDIGGKAESVSYTQQGDAAYFAEVTKAGGAKAAYLVKLAKGTNPGQWLVENITPQ
jgi:hypothetical protein